MSNITLPPGNYLCINNVGLRVYVTKTHWTQLQLVQLQLQLHLLQLRMRTCRISLMRAKDMTNDRSTSAAVVGDLSADMFDTQHMTQR